MAVPTTKVNLTTADAMNGPIPFIELYAPQEQWQENDCYVVRRLACPWTYRQQFIQNLLGTAVTNGTKTSGLTRVVPAAMPLGFGAEYNAPYGVSSGTAYNDEVKGAFSKFWAVSAKLVEGKSVPLQDQSTGALTYANKPFVQMNLNGSTADYDSATGQLKGTTSTWNGTASGYGVGDAVYDVTYRPLPFDVRSDAQMAALNTPLSDCELSRYVQRFYKFGARVLTFPKGVAYFKDDLQAGRFDRPIPEGAGLKTLPYGTWQYKWYHIPAIPWDAIWGCYGKVNASETGTDAPSGRFDYQPSIGGSSWVNGKIQGWLPKTLLFEGVSEVEPVITGNSQRLWNITYAFRYLPGKDGATQDTHNKIYRFVDNDFYEVVSNYASGKAAASWKPIYESATFTNLFKLSLFS